MGREKESPRYNVVSVRVSDDEMLMLRQLRKQRKETISELLRYALTATLKPQQNCVQ